MHCPHLAKLGVTLNNADGQPLALMHTWHLMIRKSSPVCGQLDFIAPLCTGMDIIQNIRRKPHNGDNNGTTAQSSSFAVSEWTEGIRSAACSTNEFIKEEYCSLLYVKMWPPTVVPRSLSHAILHAFISFVMMISDFSYACDGQTFDFWSQLTSTRCMSNWPTAVINKVDTINKALISGL